MINTAGINYTQNLKNTQTSECNKKKKKTKQTHRYREQTSGYWLGGMAK